MTIGIQSSSSAVIIPLLSHNESLDRTEEPLVYDLEAETGSGGQILSPMGNQKDGEIERENLRRHIIGCLYAVLFLAGLTNIFLLYIIPRRKYLRTVSNVQIFNICLADFLYSLGLPFVMVSQIKGSWVFGTTACHLLLTFEAVAKQGIICFITLAAVERYLSVCKPLFRRRHWTLRNAVFISIAAWLFAGMIMCPVIVNIEAGTIRQRYYHYVNRTHIVHSNYTIHYCNIVWPGDDHVTGEISGMKKSFVTYTSILYIFFTFTIIGSYWSIIRKVSSSSRRLLKHHTSSANTTSPHQQVEPHSDQSNATKEKTIVGNDDKDETGKHRAPLYTKRRSTNTTGSNIPSRPNILPTRNKNGGSRPDISSTSNAAHFTGGASVRARAYRKVTKMVLILVAFYFVCWTPYWTQNFLATYRLLPWNNSHRDLLRLVLNAVHMLPYLNCGVNPVIYAFLTDNFKDAICRGGGAGSRGGYDDSSNYQQQDDGGERRGRFRGLVNRRCRWRNLQSGGGSVSNNGYQQTTEVTLTTTSMRDSSTRRKSILSIRTRLYSFSSNWRSGGWSTAARARARAMSSPKLDAHRRSIPSQDTKRGADLGDDRQVGSNNEEREKLRVCSARAAAVGNRNRSSGGIMKVKCQQHKGGYSLKNQNLLMVHASPALSINNSTAIVGESSRVGEIPSERTPLCGINNNNKKTHFDFGSPKTIENNNKSQQVLISQSYPEEDQFSPLSSSSDDEPFSPTNNPEHQEFDDTSSDNTSSSSSIPEHHDATNKSKKIPAVENTSSSYVNYYQETPSTVENNGQRSKKDRLDLPPKTIITNPHSIVSRTTSNREQQQQQQVASDESQTQKLTMIRNGSLKTIRRKDNIPIFYNSSSKDGLSPKSIMDWDRGSSCDFVL